MDTKGAKTDFLAKPWPPFEPTEWDKLTEPQRKILLKKYGMEWQDGPVPGENPEAIEKFDAIMAWIYQYNQNKEILEFMGQKPEKVSPSEMDVDLYRILHIYHGLIKIAQYDARCGTKKEPQESKHLADMRKSLEDTVSWWDYKDTLDQSFLAFLKKIKLGGDTWQMKTN